MQNTADGIDSDSDYPQTSNVKGRTGHCEWDGNQVASVTSWRYAVPPCIGGAGENRDEAAFAAVVAKREWCSVDLCECCVLGFIHERCFHGDFNPAYNEMDHCVQLVGFRHRRVHSGVRLGSSGVPNNASSGLKHLRTHGYVMTHHL